MDQGVSIKANVLWATDWPEELHIPRAILGILMEHGGEPFKDPGAWKQLHELVGVRCTLLAS
jgi:hypothetical protein